MTPPSEASDFWGWLEYGKSVGWCSEIVCNTHEGTPMTEVEEEEWDQGLDPCVHVLRIWGD